MSFQKQRLRQIRNIHVHMQCTTHHFELILGAIGAFYFKKTNCLDENIEESNLNPIFHAQ